ncbi:LysR family transcriptional regulator [Paraferrimonas sedimenticola]|uniref:HTH lysR-type domain-containing protein n=1 Tax=Paraferrimonas sedimenticola TaxID=375674 RepID=A0AA37RU65_9GAMM|nr:LysR family transcriptional regulator [Paraferrimonas sedimenticola]GLP95438.1 hypothetical protein GCM10007895_07440 [Paraferrimonas sedimenticola]
MRLNRELSSLDISVFFVFKKVFETQSVGIAAKELGFQPSKVSRALAALRAALDDELFVRRKAGLTPTLTAANLYDNLSPALAQFNTAFDNIDADTHNTKKVAIHVSSYLIAAFANKLSQTCCNSSINSSDFLLHEVNESSADRLQSGEADIVISQQPVHGKDIEHELIGEQKTLYVMAAPSHEIWQAGDPGDLDSLAKFPFIYLSRDGFNDRIDPFESYCRENDILLREICKANSYAEWIANVSSGRFVTFVGSQQIMQHTVEFGGFKAIEMAKQTASILHQSLMIPRFYISYSASMVDTGPSPTLELVKKAYTELAVS